MKLYISNPVVLHERGSRDLNEDYVFPPQGEATSDTRLFIVCDGLGGTQKGNIASKIVANRVSDYLKVLPPGSDLTQFDLDQALLSAEEALSAHVKANPGSAGMGTTLSLLHIGKSQITAAWTGNSQIFYFKARASALSAADGHLNTSSVLSTDTDAVDKSKRAASRFQTIHGIESPAKIEMKRWDISEIGIGDYFLICTDGILEEVHTSNLKMMFESGQKPEKLMEEIVAFTQGETQDNYSCYLFQILRTEGIDHTSQIDGSKETTAASTLGDDPDQPTTIEPEEVKKQQTIALVIIGAVILMAIGLSIFSIYDNSEKTQTKFDQFMVEGHNSLKAKQFSAAITNFDSAYNATQNIEAQIEARQMKATALAAEKEEIKKTPVSTYLQRANQAYEVGDYERAVENYDYAIFVKKETGELESIIPYNKLADSYLKLAQTAFEANNENKDFRQINEWYNKAFELYDSPEVSPPSNELYETAKRNYSETNSILGGNISPDNSFATRGAPGVARPYSGNSLDDNPQTRSGEVTSLDNLMDKPSQNKSSTLSQSNNSTARKSSSGATRSTPAPSATPVVNVTMGQIQNLKAGMAAYERARVTNSPTDYQSSIQYLTNTGNALDGKGAYLLAYMYHSGKGVPVNDGIALDYAKYSALKGWSSGQYLYAHLLLERNNPVDRATAIAELRKAAAQNHQKAINRLRQLN